MFLSVIDLLENFTVGDLLTVKIVTVFFFSKILNASL